MSDELLPCPFDSQHQMVLSADDHDENWYVLHKHVECCADCAGPYPSKADAIAAWNRRPANPQPAGQAPAGYVLVPVEPTQEMLPQAWLIAQRGGIDQEGLMTHDRLRQIYRAMIAAAPTASLAQEVPTWKDRLNGKRDPADIMLCMQDEIEELRAALVKDQQHDIKTSKPAVVAWMHDGEGRHDVCHDKAKELWLKVNADKAEHYTIPLCRCADVPAKALTEDRIMEIGFDHAASTPLDRSKNYSLFANDGLVAFARAIEAELKGSA